MAAVLVVIAIAAVAFAIPARAAMSKPAWTAGDYWAYAMSAGPAANGTQRIDVLGQEIVTVVGRPYLSYRTLFDSRVVLAGAPPAYFNLTGTAWYRTSDLALVMQDLNGTIESPPFSFSIWERITWDPPQDIHWPLIPGDGWTATSWMNTSVEVGGPPPFYTNVSVTTSFAVEAERPVTVPAGTFPTTPLNATTNGYSNVTYWSPVAGNGVLIQTFDSTGAEMQRLELTSYRYQAGGTDTTPPAIADVAATPPMQTAGGTVTISANVTDNVAVAGVSVNVTLPDGSHVNRTMVRGAGNTYAYASTWSQVGMHTFVIWALDAAGNPASATGSFVIVASNLPPTVSLTSPVGGEDWSGGSVHSLDYAVSDPDNVTLDITVEWSVDDGATWNPGASLPGQPTGGHSYAWTVPVVDTATARVRVCASDRVNPRACDASGSFTIDSTRPAVASTDPADGATDVPLGKPVTITFGEAVNQTAAIQAISFSPAVSGPVYGWSANVLTIGHDPFAPCTQYTVTLTGAGVKDASDPGNAMAADYAWSFTTVCAPVVTLDAPAGGETWAGGSLHDVTFTVTSADASVTVWVNLSADGGSSWSPLRPPGTEPAGAPVTVSVTMPAATDTTNALIRVTAEGSARLDGTATSPPFTIDSTRPSITGVAADPPSRIGAGSVALSATVTDNLAVSTVSVNVTLPDGSHVNRTMIRGAGDAYAYTATWNQVGAHPFVVWASDTAGNWASASGSFTIAADTTPPSITASGPDAVYVGDTITIEATVTDADGAVQEVRLVYTPVGGTEQNVTMTLSGGVYTYAIPAQSGPGTVRYRVYAVDTSGNAKLTQEYTVEVRERPSATGIDVGLIAAVVVILVVAILTALMLVVRRRRKGHKTPPAQPP